jgi:hypothetical protein
MDMSCLLGHENTKNLRADIYNTSGIINISPNTSCAMIFLKA